MCSPCCRKSRLGAAIAEDELRALNSCGEENALLKARLASRPSTTRLRLHRRQKWNWQKLPGVGRRWTRPRLQRYLSAVQSELVESVETNLRRKQVEEKCEQENALLKVRLADVESGLNDSNAALQKAKTESAEAILKRTQVDKACRKTLVSSDISAVLL